ncbi:4Fe-4S binding protein [Arundinibacter roseus]|uniref:4Fe-4S binding protein n=1 Tax=Arundinibacter roseus TaxID=2070510 RepID=A0A4R4KIS6_9BACT|nr:4Fe-4S binding protein [Arundinibacter roseus]TDB68150.1 4Fe-4S binding protein [Arundinibacter roseus]
MQTIQKIGLGLFLTGFAVWIVTLSLGQFVLTENALKENLKPEHYELIRPRVQNIIGQTYSTAFGFGNAFRAEVETLNEEFRSAQKYDQVIYDNYSLPVAKASSQGTIIQQTGLWFWLSFGLAILGAFLYILPNRRKHPGIKNDHIYHSPATSRGWIGIVLGSFLILFYIALYFYPEYVVNWIILVDPLSQALSGNPASQWFLYGFLYTLAVVIMGIRMLIKYRHSPYQMLRSLSVMFFQTSFAFLIPEILIRLNQPYYDFKNIWPLDYDFFFEFNLNTLISNGTLGLFMLGWGIALIVIAVPIFSYFFGKRWYCSWVCGCGGLAETLGDPYRQLSDKSLKSWKIERYMVHGVLVFAIVMTAFVLYTYFTGQSNVGPIDSYTVRSAYGFWIGALFSGVVGTGFYPLMGNRVWCRFGCPLAAYLGLVQRFKSRFRITTNGGQCISCGNCSTYCEMGIDVRWYAQRGQDIVRSSCVGCGICSSVCPRGVLNLENADPNSRVMIAPELMTGNEMPKIG